MRIAKQLAREEDDVGLSVSQQLVRLVGRAEQSDGAGQDASLVANPLRERNLVPGPDGNLRACNVPAGRAVDQIDTFAAQRARDRDGLIDVEAALGPVGR